MKRNSSQKEDLSQNHLYKDATQTSRKKVYLSEQIAPEAYERLASHFAIVTDFDHPEELDAMIIRRAVVTGDTIRQAKKLKLISMHGVGLDTIDVAAAKECGVPVINVPGQSAESVAELSIAYMLTMSRKMKFADKGLSEGRFNHFGMKELTGEEIYGKKLGLIGSGHIACRVAEIAKSAFHMELFCYNPHESEAAIRALGFQKVDSLQGLFASMDFISIHIPLTESTKNLISAEVIAAANPNLILVNTARGGIVDEAALYQALKNGQMRGAGFDVFEEEIPNKNTPLFTLDNFMGSLHIGGSTNEALSRVSKVAVDHVFQYLDVEE